MSGFVWVKTIRGARTAGFFAFKASDGKLYASDGTGLDPPPNSVMIFGEELITAISKSGSKGMYVCAWYKTSDVWSRYMHQVWNEHLDAYSMVDNAIAKISVGAGIQSPHNSSKEVVAQKKADAMAKKDNIESNFKQSVKTTLQLLKTMTVRALARAPRALALALVRALIRARARALVRALVRALALARALVPRAERFGP